MSFLRSANDEMQQLKQRLLEVEALSILATHISECAEFYLWACVYGCFVLCIDWQLQTLLIGA